MKLNYNVTGSERKALVGKVSTILNAPTKYLGAPNFAYEVGSYHIDKVGTLTGPDNLDLEDALHQAGFNADGESRHYDEPDTYKSGMGALDEFPDIDQHHPGRHANPNAPITKTMERQIDEVIAFEDLRMDGREELGLGHTRREDFQGENGMQASDVPEEDDVEESCDSLIISYPRKDISDAALENLRLLIASKESLIKKALGADALPIEVDDETVSFPWFNGFPQPEEVSAYAHFTGKLIGMAKTQKRVTAKEREPDNEKYAFRCFLLRLGFIGDEYKAARKILLRSLSGSGAFKSGNPKVRELVERINTDVGLYDDVMRLQDKEVADNE